MNVLMLYPRFAEPTFFNPSRVTRQLAGRSATMAPLGLLTLAAYLPDDFAVRLVDRNLAAETEADWGWADVVFLSAMAAQQADLIACVTAAKARGTPVAVGGPLTHNAPAEVAAAVDWVCFGEAEDIMGEFVADLRAGRRPRQYQGGNATDVTRLRLPRFDLMPDVNAHMMMPIQFSRGCPFCCEFCDIIEIYGRVPRTKRPAQVLAELDELVRLGYRGMVFLVDDNFIGNRRNARAMLEALAAWNAQRGYPFLFHTEASLNLADDLPLLEAMSRANFLSVFIGIETPDPALLRTTRKLQNVPGNPLAKVATVRAHGIDVSAGFIVGFDGEDGGVFEAQRAFIEAAGIGVAIVSLLVAIPNTQLERRLRREGRFLELCDFHRTATFEGINFIPRGSLTKREYLRGYAQLVETVCEPRAALARSVRGLLALRPCRGPAAVARVVRDHWRMFCRQAYQLGVRPSGLRAAYWKALLTILVRNPRAIGAFVFDGIFIHHLGLYRREVSRMLAEYLASPRPDDILDTAWARAEAAAPVAAAAPDA